jgi:D-alanine---D-serine ligase
MIAVLFGGCSPEYKVSLASAAAVLAAVDRTRYFPLPVGISRAGDWYLYEGPVERIAPDGWTASACVPAAISPNRSCRELTVFRPDGTEHIRLDAVFPVLHGQNGEDGTVQGLCALAGIPIVGCGVLASALGMDKLRARAVAASAGVRVPRAVEVPLQADGQRLTSEAEALGYPLFVKPLRAGSSFGISRVTEPAALADAVERARRFDDRVLLEEAVPGFEVGCAVLGTGENLTLGIPDEIELQGDLFSYTEKYQLLTSRIHVPARVTEGTLDRIRETAATVYRALGCEGFARVDLFLTPEGKLVLGEVNTIPGFTSHSRFPKMMEAAGLPFEALVNRLIREVLERS